MLVPNSTLQQGRYRIIRHLSSGGMGAVYEAFDNRLQTKVAIKEALVSDAALKRAFSKEALRLARLHHAALPNVSDHFTEYQRQYLVMRFIEGQDLADMLRIRRQPFPVAQVLAWGEQLLDVLAYLHSEGVIHRDIKPANIKLTPKGKLFLLDLGLAKGGLTQQTLAGMSLKGYTPGFAPPEQIRGLPTNEQSDLYALAATLYALLTGETPEAASVRQRVIAHHVPDPLRPANELNPQVPTHVAQALSQAMALNPANRPASAQAMRALLAPAARPSPQPTVPGSWRATLAQKWWQPALALFLLLLVVGTIWSFTGSNNPPTPETASEPQATEAIVVVEVPTNTPSPTQTANQTPKPTETATQVPTETASQTPKPTETATQTPSATAIPSPSPPTAEEPDSQHSTCENLSLDLEAGTLNGVSPLASQEEIKAKFPCYTGTTEEEEGSVINYGGGVFFRNHDFYFYTLKDVINVRSSFRGNVSNDLLGKNKNDLIELLGVPTIESPSAYYYDQNWGCLKIEIDSVVRELLIQHSSCDQAQFLE